MHRLRRLHWRILGRACRVLGEALLRAECRCGARVAAPYRR